MLLALVVCGVGWGGATWTLNWGTWAIAPRSCKEGRDCRVRLLQHGLAMGILNMAHK